MAVTVLVDTYNYGRFIEEAIDSVLAQDFPPEQMEILVVDDGSADDTADRVRWKVRAKTSRVVGFLRGVRVAIEGMLPIRS